MGCVMNEEENFMVRKIISIIMVSCLFLNGCSKEEKNIHESARETVMPLETIDVAQPSVSIDYINLEEPPADGSMYNTYSNNYWHGVLGKKKEEIDFLVNWIKKIDYCETISFRRGVLYTEPDNKRTRKKIKNETDYKMIKEIISENEFNIYNDWFRDQRITILHTFDVEGQTSGNYCLLYMEGQLKKLEKKKCKKVDKNYYSEVIFYE